MNKNCALTINYIINTFGYGFEGNPYADVVLSENGFDSHLSKIKAQALKIKAASLYKPQTRESPDAARQRKHSSSTCNLHRNCWSLSGSRVLLSGFHRHVGATFRISTGGESGRAARNVLKLQPQRCSSCRCCCPRMNCEILWALHNYQTAGTFSLLSGASGTDFCTCIYKTKHLFLELKDCNNMSS